MFEQVLPHRLRSYIAAKQLKGKPGRHPSRSIAVITEALETRTMLIAAANHTYTVYENQIYEPTSSTLSFLHGSTPASGVSVYSVDDDPDNVDDSDSNSVDYTTPVGADLELNENGSFSYHPAIDFLGSDTFNYAITDGTTVSSDASVTFNVVQPAVSVTTYPIMASRAVALSNVTVAEFSGGSGNSSNFTASINWGDGSTTAGTISGFTVEGSHTYALAGSFSASVTVTDTTISGSAVTAAVTASVIATPLIARDDEAGAAAMTATSPATVATFTDPVAPLATSDYSAIIHYGDGATSAGTITLSGSTFSVSGAHSYSSDGTYAINTFITEIGTPAVEATDVFHDNGTESASGTTALILNGSSASNQFYLRWYDGYLQDFQNVTPPAAGVAGTPTQSVLLSSLSNVEIVGGSGVDTVTVDYSTISGADGESPFGSGLSFTGGSSGSDQLIIIDGGGSSGSPHMLDITKPTSGATTAIFSMGGSSIPGIISFTNAAVQVQAVSGAENLFATGTLSVSLTVDDALENVTVLAGASLILANDGSGLGGSTAVVVGDGGSATLQAGQKLSSLDVEYDATATVAPFGGTALTVGALLINSTGKLDLTNNDLIVHSGILSSITQDIIEGRDGSAWDGLGLTSSQAEINPYNTLGVELNHTGSGTAVLLSTFDGQSVSCTDVLVKYTYVGDADLSGSVTTSDYTLIDNGYNNNSTGWHNGDFDYDGHVTGSDYSLIDGGYDNEAATEFHFSGSVVLNSAATLNFQFAGPVQINWGDGSATETYTSGSSSYPLTYNATTSFYQASYTYHAAGTYFVNVASEVSGVWHYYVGMKVVVTAPNTLYFPISLTNSGGTSFSLSLNSGGSTVEASDNDGHSASGSPSYLTSVLMGSSSTSSLTIDYTNGDPLPLSGVTFVGSKLTIIGPSSGTYGILVGTSTVSITSGGVTKIIYYAPGTAVFFHPGAGTVSLISAGGLVTVTSDVSSSGQLSAQVGTDATVQFNSTVHLTDLNIGADGTARVAEAGNADLVTQSLEIANPVTGTNPYNGGVLDLADNDLIVRYASGTHVALLDEINGWVAAGYDGGKWDGASPTTGALSPASIVSSIAQADPAGIEALGIGQVGESGGVSGTNFDGQTLSSGDVFVKFTYYGDTNLDGVVDSNDNYVSPGSDGTGDWSQGDFTYDGQVNGTDAALLQTITTDQKNLELIGGPVSMYVGQTISTLPTKTPTGATIASWMANFGSGYTTFSATSLPSPYSTPGSYTAVFVALDSAGNPIYRYPRQYVTVQAFPPPSVSPLVIPPAIQGSATTVTATVVPFDNNDDALTYDWTFTNQSNPSDTTSFTTSGPTETTFVPDAAGTWSVSLTVTDTTLSNSTTVTGSMTVAAPVYIEINGPVTLSQGQTANYTAFGSAITDVTWSAYIGSTVYATGTGTQFSFTPSASNTYTISASGLDGMSVSHTATVTLQVSRLSPDVMISGPAIGFVGKSLVFGSTVTQPPGLSDTITYSWSLIQSDGTAVAGVSSALPTFVVPGTLAAGGYAAELTATDTDDDGVAIQQSFGFSVLPVPTGASSTFEWGAAQMWESVPSSTLPLEDMPTPYEPGQNGIYSDYSGGSTLQFLSRITRQPDGKVLVAQSIEYIGTTPWAYHDVAWLARFNPDLTLDTSFGPSHTGIIQVDFTNGQLGGTSEIYSVSINPTNNDIIVAGMALDPGFQDAAEDDLEWNLLSTGLSVAEFVSQPSVIDGTMVLPGTPDPRFNDGLPFSLAGTANTKSAAFGVTVLSDGSMLVSGVEKTNATTAEQATIDDDFGIDTPYPQAAVPDFLLIKLSAEGALYSDFGTAGVADEPDVTGLAEDTPFSSSATDLEDDTWNNDNYYENFSPISGWTAGIQDLVIMPDNSILAGGSACRFAAGVSFPTTSYYTDAGFALVHYTASGHIDTAALGTGSGTFGDDGSGVTFTSSNGFNGTPLGTADFGGMEVINPSSESPEILIGGFANSASDAIGYHDANMVFAWYNSGGELDSAYGDATGIIVTSITEYVNTTNSGLLNQLDALFGEPSSSNFFASLNMISAAFLFQGSEATVSYINYNTDTSSYNWNLSQVNATDGSLDSSQLVDPSVTDAEVQNSDAYDASGIVGYFQPVSMVFDGDDGILLASELPGLTGAAKNESRPEPLLVRYKTADAPALSNLEAVSTSSTAVTLTWQNSGFDQSYFEIRRSTSPFTTENQGTLLGDVGPDQFDYTDSLTGTNSTLYYEVTPYSTNDSGTDVAGTAVTTSVEVLPASDAGYQLQEVLNVPADGDTVTSLTSLTAGQTYVLVVSGAVELGTSFTADANGWFYTDDPQEYGHQFGTYNVGLALTDSSDGSGLTVPYWGTETGSPCEYTFAFTGQGHHLTLNYESPITATDNPAVPLQIEIYADPRSTASASSAPTEISGQPSLWITVPTADNEATPAVLSVAGEIDVLAAMTGSTVPWQLVLTSPTGTTTVLDTNSVSSGSQPSTTAAACTIDPADYPDGVYTLELTTTFSTGPNYSTTMALALEKPVVQIVSPSQANFGIAPIINSNTPIDILSACPDGTALPWTLYLDSPGDTAETVLASGSGQVGYLPAEGENEAVLNPALYPNGLYTLKLTAGEVTTTQQIEIETTVKVGNFSLPATDGVLNTSVGPITISREYNSGLLSGGSLYTGPTFSPGWTLSLLDTQLSVTEEADTYDTNPTTPADTTISSEPTAVLRAGDLIALTVPDDGRHVFEFAPILVNESTDYQGNIISLLYKPYFIAIDGSGATLSLPLMKDWLITLVYDQASGEYVVNNEYSADYQNGIPGGFVDGGSAGFRLDGTAAFNPARPLFDIENSSDTNLLPPEYQLTTKDGTSYIIDAGTGEITSLTNKNGTTITYTVDGSGNVTATDQAGQTVFTINSTDNRINSISVPGQQTITYHYVSGNLTSVTNSDGTTSYSYQSPNAGQQHYLTGVTSPDGQTLLQAEYDTSGHLAAIINASGIKVPVTSIAIGTDEVIQTVVDAMGNITQDVFNEQYGTLDRQIQTVTDDGGDYYLVTVSKFTYVTDDLSQMFSTGPSGIQVLQELQTFAPFEVSGSDPTNTRYTVEPSADSWTNQVVFDTSNDPDDPAFGQILSTSQRLTDGGQLQTTLNQNYAIVNAALNEAKPLLVVVEIQTPNSNQPDGYDNVVQSMTYASYDSQGDLLYTINADARDPSTTNDPGDQVFGDIGEGSYPSVLEVAFSGLSDSSDNYRQILPWDVSTSAYQWSATTSTGGTLAMALTDTSLAMRGSGGPKTGDSWTLSFSDSKWNGGDGIAGSLTGLSFNGNISQLTGFLNTLFPTDSTAANPHLTDDSYPSETITGGGGITATVPGWIGDGTASSYTGPGGSTPAGLVENTYVATANIDADGTVHESTGTGLTNSQYYGTGDYTLAGTAYVPDPGASYGQVKYSFSASGQETFYAYDSSGRTILQFTYKEWMNPSGSQVYGWVGTESAYDSSGRLTDTYQATYLDTSTTAGETADRTLPVTTGGVAGLQVDTSSYTYLSLYSPLLRTQHIDYNSLGQKADTVDQYGGKTSYTYDAFGNVIQTVYPNGTETLAVYDLLNRAIWSTNQFDPSNLSTCVTTHTVYNQLGQVTQTLIYTGATITIGTTSVGSASVGTSSASITGATLISTTQTFYDAAGNAIETISPTGLTGSSPGGLRTGSIYYPNGQVEYTGPLTTSATDGGTLATTYAGVSSNEFTTGSFLVNSSTGYTQTLYDQYNATLGLFYTRMIDQNGHHTDTYTDAEGRTVRTVYDDGSFTETLYSIGGTTVARDQEGDSLSSPQGIASGGSETVNIAQRNSGDAPVATYDFYDASGNLTDVYQPAVVDGDSQDNGTDGRPDTYGTDVVPHWHYTYDSSGNELTQISPMGHDASGAYVAGGNVTTFGYDQNGNQVRQILPGGQAETYTYDLFGNEKTFTDFNGNVATYTYATSGAEAGLLQQVVYVGASGSGKATQTVTYTYDDLNRQATVTDASGTTTSHYDAFGNLIESDTPEGDIYYVFDPATGNHTETYTANTQTDYGYDTEGRLTSVTVVKLNGTTLSTPLVTTYTYAAAGNKVSETLPDGEVTTYTYDDLNRLTNITEVRGSTTIFSQIYTLNPDGTRATSTESQKQTDGSTLIIDTAWTYDADQRLTEEQVTSGDTDNDYTDTYSYDLDNNRTKEVHTGPGGGSDETITYVYNGDDELISQDSSLSGTTTNTYDANGSQLTGTTSSNVTTYTYDVRNKMVGYSDGTNSATYVYDDDGDRVSETATSGGTTTTTLYLTDTQNPTGYDQPIEQKTSATAAPTITYIIGDRILGQSDSSSNVTYLLVDGHGSTQQLTNASGTTTSALRYDAFGTALNFTPGTIGTVFQFAGDSIYDPVSGLDFHGDGERPTNGFLFIQRDTYLGSSQDPLSLNRYLYANAQPINDVDSNGHFIDTLISVGITLAQYASTLGEASVATGIAGAVVFGLTAINASVGVAISQSYGDTAGVAFYSGVESMAIKGVEDSLILTGAGLALNVLGSVLTDVVTASKAIADPQNTGPIGTNAQAAAILKTLPPAQIAGLQRWLGTGLPGRLSAGIAPTAIDTATLLAYRAAILANLARGVTDNGVQQASIDAINASLSSRGISP